MKLLTNEKKKEMKMEKVAIFAKKNFRINVLKIKNIVKAGTIDIIQVNKGDAHNTCNLKYGVPK